RGCPCGSSARATRRRPKRGRSQTGAHRQGMRLRTTRPRSVVSREVGVQHCEAARLETEAEVLVQPERVSVAFLCVDHGAYGTTTLHPAKAVEDERGAAAVLALPRIDGEPLKEAARTGATRHGVSDDALESVDDSEAARRSRVDRFVEPGTVETPERGERAGLDSERGGSVPTAGAANGEAPR